MTTKAQDEEITVESALKELQATFPERVAGQLAIIAQGYDIAVGGRLFHGQTLSEAMDRVRAWRKEQEK